VTFITGHGTGGAVPALDWNAVAKASPTIVLYMALAHADEIAAKLMDAGRAPDEPVAIVSDATFEKQNVRIATLAELGARAKESGAPAIVVIGENVRLREGLDWIGAMSGRLLSPDPLGNASLSDAL
jgi:uroporphyrin-III C-methyltransferase